MARNPNANNLIDRLKMNLANTYIAIRRCDYSELSVALLSSDKLSLIKHLKGLLPVLVCIALPPHVDGKAHRHCYIVFFVSSFQLFKG